MPIETITKAGKRRYRWTFERVIAGNRIRKTKILPPGISATEADRLAREWEGEEYAKATGLRKSVVTIGECVRKHIEDKANTWKDEENRKHVLAKYASEYEDQDATELHEWSKQFVGFMKSSAERDGSPKKPVTEGTAKTTLAYIRAAIKYAHKVGMLEVDQTARMVFPSVNNQRHNYPQRAEMLSIARKCGNREVRAAIRIAFYSGMRRAEILRARVTKMGYALDDTKNGKPRIVPIHPRIAVLARRVRFTIDGPMFSYFWDQARRRAGYPETRFHDLRHAAASEMINSGVDLYTVGGVLGHLSSNSTKRYAHLVTDSLKNAVHKIGKKR